MVMILLKRSIYLLCIMTITLAVSAGLRHCLQPDGYQLIFDERLSTEGCRLIEQSFAHYTDSAVNKDGVSAADFLECVCHYLPHVVSVSIRKYPSGQATVSVRIAEPFVAIKTEDQIRHLYTHGVLAEACTLSTQYARTLPVVSLAHESAAVPIAKVVADLMRIQQVVMFLAHDSACVCRTLSWFSSHEITCTVVNEAVGEPLTMILDSTYPSCQTAVRKAVELYTKGTVSAPCKADVRFDGQIVFMKGE